MTDRRYVELLPDSEGMSLTDAERAEWEAMFAQQREAEAAGAPHGRCTNENYDADYERPNREHRRPCNAVLLPGTVSGTYCPACLWRDVRECGSDG